MLNSLRAVIWDLDGVIIDSAEEHRQAWQRLAQEEGIRFTDADFWATFGKRNDDIITKVWGTLPPSAYERWRTVKKSIFANSSARRRLPCLVLSSCCRVCTRQVSCRPWHLRPLWRTSSSSAMYWG